MKKALITGGGGFLGRALAKELKKSGYEVRVMGRRDYPNMKKDGFDTFKGDVADYDSVYEACKDIDIVFHAASLASIRGKYAEFHNTNVVGTENVIKACREHSIRKIVYTSSPSVVFDGKTHLNMDESLPYPTEYLAHYPETKAIAERMIIEANDKNLLTVSLRPHLIWGPGDTNLIPRLLERAKKGNLMIVGSGHNIIDNTFIDNAVDAHILAAEKLVDGSVVAGQCYFITQGEPVKCWDWINNILRGFNIPLLEKRVSFNAAYRGGAILELVYWMLGINSEPRMTRFLAAQLATSHTYSIEKAKRDLGYMPKVSTAEGMERLFRYDFGSKAHSADG